MFHNETCLHKHIYIYNHLRVPRVGFPDLLASFDPESLEFLKRLLLYLQGAAPMKNTPREGGLLCLQIGWLVVIQELAQYNKL
jgi:hypothetical protein